MKLCTFGSNFLYKVQVLSPKCIRTVQFVRLQPNSNENVCKMEEEELE